MEQSDVGTARMGGRRAPLGVRRGGSAGGPSGARKFPLWALIAAAVVVAIAGWFGGSFLVDRFFGTEYASRPVDSGVGGVSAPTKPLDLSEGSHQGVVLISTSSSACWKGFIGAEEIDGCGSLAYEVSGAPEILGANVELTGEDASQITLSIQDSAGNVLGGDSGARLVTASASLSKGGKG